MWFLRIAPGPEASASLGNLLELHIVRSTPDLLNQNYWDGAQWHVFDKTQVILMCAQIWEPLAYFIFHGKGNGTPLQYSCLENPMDRGAWWAAVYGVTQSWTRLSDFTFTFHFHALKKEMATHSSISCLEKSMDRRACWTTVLGISESRTWLSTHQMHLTLGHFFMHLSPRAFGKCSQFSSPYLSGKYLVDWGFPWSLHFSCEEVCWTGRLKNRDDDDRVASHCHCQETRVWKITLRTTHELTLPGLVY